MTAVAPMVRNWRPPVAERRRFPCWTTCRQTSSKLSKSSAAMMSTREMKRASKTTFKCPRRWTRSHLLVVPWLRQTSTTTRSHQSARSSTTMLLALSLRRVTLSTKMKISTSECSQQTSKTRIRTAVNSEAARLRAKVPSERMKD